MIEYPTICGLLQNQWFPPDRVEQKRRLFEKWDWPHRARAASGYLQLNAVTGYRLLDAFGPMFDRIKWGEASPEITDRPNVVVKPDPEHIAAFLVHWRPTILLTFGRVAALGWAMAEPAIRGVMPPIITLAAPHPAARYGNVKLELQSMADRLRGLLIGQGIDPDIEPEDAPR